ncbi:MAG: hypothetical protein V4631_00705 [Pseudomonadota bacterium]
MKKTITASLWLVAAGAFAGDPAYTVRPTELKAKPFSDSSTVARLAASSQVDVIERQASWLQVKASGSTGWVKMLSVRFNQIGSSPQAGATNSSLGVLFSISQTGSGGSVPTTGVKGINEEALRNPRPNAVALQQMHTMDASAADARAFARSGKLASVSLAYVAAPGERP